MNSDDPKQTWQTGSGTFVAVGVNYCTGQLCNVEDVEDAEHYAVTGGAGAENLEAGTASVEDTCRQRDCSRQQDGFGHTLVAWQTDSGFFLSDNAQSYHCVEKDREGREH